MPRTRFATAAALVFASIACAEFGSSAQAQCRLFPLGGYVGIFGEGDGRETTVFFPDPSRPDTLHVLAVLDGATSDGFTGVQFRIEVTQPDGWFLIPSFTADAQLGNVFDLEPNDPYNTAGIFMGWRTCQTGPKPGPGQIIPIGTIRVFTVTGRSTDLLVKRTVPASNPGAPCARFDRCDSPNFSRAPMPAREVDSYGEEIVFRTRLVRDTGVSVERGTWSAVKKLYTRE